MPRRERHNTALPPRQICESTATTRRPRARRKALPTVGDDDNDCGPNLNAEIYRKVCTPVTLAAKIECLSGEGVFEDVTDYCGLGGADLLL